MKEAYCYIFSLLLSVFFISGCYGQISDDNSFTVIFYNVENLFDTLDNPYTEDEEFTPMSEKNWDTEKYSKKLEDITKVLSSVSGVELPEIIGLAEVENRQVLEDLVVTGKLKDGNYGIVHSDSPDGRGIDVALLYRKDELSSLDYNTLPVEFPFDTTEKTRDILHVKAKLKDGKPVHFFVNHWSSRYGGQKETEPKRMYCAVRLRRSIDMILARESDARFIIMGDFNDEPTNKSVMDILLAANKRKNIYPGELFNLHYDMHNTGGKGSYNYRGNWNMLDHIICSYNLINSPGSYSCSYNDGKIFSEEWMMYETDEGIRVPSRSYGGPQYFGGISDHLPVYVTLTID